MAVEGADPVADPAAGSALGSVQGKMRSSSLQTAFEDSHDVACLPGAET